MKLPEHLEKRRDELERLYPNHLEGSREKAVGIVGFRHGYNAAVADMLKEVEPLIEALIILTDDADFFSGDVRKLSDWNSLLKALQDWQAKFGEK